jgi:hypothetical protein
MRRGEYFLGLPWAFGTLWFSIRVIGAKLFLVYLYGWVRVREDHLTILRMPKGHPWPVSNGDFIDPGATGVHYVIALLCWFAIFLATYPFLRLVLPKAKAPVE